MPDPRSAMKEFRLLDEKRRTRGLSPEEEKRYAQLRDLVGPDSGASGLRPGFDVDAAAARLRESLLPAGLRNRPAPPPAEAVPEPIEPEPATERDALEAFFQQSPFTPLDQGGPDPTSSEVADFDPASLAAEGPSEAAGDPGAATWTADAQAQDPGATTAWDPNFQPDDPDAAAAWDPNAQPTDPDAATAWDPNAQPYDPNAAAASDPNGQPYDPNAAAAWDPNFQPDDPNAAAAWDPNAQPYDESAVGADPDAPADDGAPMEVAVGDLLGHAGIDLGREPAESDFAPADPAAPAARGEYDAAGWDADPGSTGAQASWDAPPAAVDDGTPIALGEPGGTSQATAGDAWADPSAEPFDPASLAESQLASPDAAPWDSPPAADAPRGDYDDTAAFPSADAAPAGGALALNIEADAELESDGEVRRVAAAAAPGVEPGTSEPSGPGYDDAAGFASGPLDPSALEPAPGDAAPAEVGAAPAEWQPDAVLAGEFELESGGSFEGAPTELPALDVTADVTAPPEGDPWLEDLPTIDGEEILEEIPPEAETVALTAVATAYLPGEHRVVVHLIDGTVKRGVLSDPDLGAPELALAPQPGGAPEVLATDRVRSISFQLAPGERPPAAEGRRIRVTFHDGRQVSGVSPDCDDEGVGFFVVPGDARAGTGRTWVFRSAVRDIAAG